MFTLPLWLILALLSPLFWAIVYVLDAYCVEEVFERPWVGSVTSSIAMLVALPILLAGLAVDGIAPMSAKAMLLACLSGMLFMAGQLFYFRAMSRSESGIVAAYFNLLPVLLLLVGYFFMGEWLGPVKYLGSLLLVVCSVLFCLVDSNRAQRWEAFVLMLFATGSQVAYFLILDHVLKTCPVYQTFVLVTLSMIVSGFLPLGTKQNRRIFSSNWPRIRQAMGFLVAIEVANLLAVGANQYALKLGPASLVAAVEATGPGYTLALSAVLFSLFRRYGEPQARQQIAVKLTLVCGMTIGVYLVS